MASFLGGSGTINTTSSTGPWEKVQPYLGGMFEEGRRLYNAGPFNPSWSWRTDKGWDLQAQKALDPNSLIGRSQRMLGQTINGRYLDPNSNPFLKKTVKQALGLAGSTFAGQYGGNAGSNLSNSGYQEQLGRTLADTAMPYYMQNYQQERGNQLNATRLAPQMDYAAIDRLRASGEARDDLRKQQWMSPWENLGMYQKAISGNFGSQTSGQTPYYSNPWATGAGLLTAGASVYGAGSDAGWW